MIVGKVVYPLPADAISMVSTLPFNKVATAVALIPQSSLGAPIVTVGGFVYPVPAELTFTLPIVLYNASTKTTCPSKGRTTSIAAVPPET